METVRTITIYSKEVKDGKKTFVVSSAKIGERWYKIKFVQGCAESPKTSGVYNLTIDFDDCSLEKGKPYTSATGRQGISNDTIWVRHIVGLTKYTEDDLKHTNRAVFEGIFGEV